MATEQEEIARLQQANALGLEFLKAIILLNGGAILALLTFIGNASASAAIQFNLANVKCSMWAFLVGIASILLGLIISYSYTATNPEARYHGFWDKHIVRFNSALAFFSLVAFFFGVVSLILGAMPPK